MSRRLKIAQVTTADMTLRFLLLDQLDALQEAGHEVACICSPGVWVQELRERGLRVETIPMRRCPSVCDLQALTALYRVFKAYRFDVVHTHTPKAGLLGPIAARMAGVPVVLHTIHGLMFHDGMPLSGQALYWLPEKLTAVCSDYLLSQSREDVERAIATGLCGPDRIRWIGNGIDLHHFSRRAVDGDVRRELGLTEDDFVVGCVSRLVHHKGINELFLAAKWLLELYPHLKFMLIGLDEHDHPKRISRSRLEPLVSSGRMLFAGERKDMPRCYAAMDVLVLPSYREGVPRACLEASAMGVPVIATDIRGCREAVVPGQTGLLVPVRDPGALAQAIRRMMLNPGLCRAMGDAGRQFVRANFDARAVLRRVADVYREIEDKMFGKRFAAAQGSSDTERCQFGVDSRKWQTENSHPNR